MNIPLLIENFNKKEFYLPEEFGDWYQELENNYLKIKEEYLKFIKLYNNNYFKVVNIDDQQNYLTKDKKWKMILLKFFDNKYLLESFPETHKLINLIPNCVNVFYSILPPHTKLEEHTGYYFGFIRYHLGIIIDEPDKSFIKVNGIKKNWKEGGSLFFNDLYLHHAENNSDYERVILFVDLKKNLPTYLEKMNNIFLNEIYKVKKYIHDNWIEIIKTFK